MASLDSINHKGNGTKNLKVHFEIPQQDSNSSISSYSSVKSADTQKFVYDTIDRTARSATQCPTTQMMGRTGYDPSRIPSDIFSSKPTNPMEWSLASNESLFSLHIGNVSFSTLNKSEELVRVEECMSVPVEGNSTATDSSEEMEKIELSAAENAMGHNSEEAGNSTTIFHHFEENMVLYTNGSFQFPVLTGNGERNSSETMESEKQETEKPLEAALSPKSKTAPNPGGGRREWFHCFYFCSPCY